MAKDYTEQEFEPIATGYYQEDCDTTDVSDMAILVTKEDLISQLGKSDRTIRTWIKIVKEAYHWLPEEELSIRQGKRILYTRLTLEQLEQIKAHIDLGCTLDDWKNRINQPEPKLQQEEPETITTSAIEVLGQNNLDLTIELPTHQGSEELIDLNTLGIFGSEALAQAQEELAAQKQKLADTKVNLANSLLSMAKQAAMNQAAEETRKQLELEQACEEAFQQELHRLQAIENARLQARQAHQQIKQNLGK